MAIDGVRDLGWDIEYVTDFDVEVLRAALEDERPLITSVHSGQVGEVAFGHAVILCGLDADHAVVMDPLVGDYVQVPVLALSSVAGHRFRGGFFITGLPIEGQS